ncbi:helix-turn-helix domain-containing protein [Spirosoma montaniterrae]|uniref:Transcriptional regulator n=1 Tax=Spirosoma montaniterrae TaxID=1178516 RepID=A0A1P9WT81_9BACT|nr:ATP-binding protein [Spirosoma montaniterrae]AQG78595.1 transcriptional regulator [Spirosoma montaniterrae]
MTFTELIALIEQGESNRLEFKRTLSSAHRIARTLAAFANTAGGTLLIGVADDGRITGVSSELREMRKIEEATDQLINPPLTVSYQTIAPDGRNVLIINVPESDEKPHTAISEAGKHTIYVRARDKSVPTNQLIINPEPADAQLLKSPTARTLIQYLRKNDHITADKFAKLINVSEYRATKLLRQFAGQGLLLLIDNQRAGRYALKLTE